VFLLSCYGVHADVVLASLLIYPFGFSVGSSDCFCELFFGEITYLVFLVQLCLFQQAEQELSISGAKASFGILTPVLLI
jgi:hypothetical protein